MATQPTHPLIYSDQLTGIKTIKPDYSTKPIPSKARSLPNSTQPCPFCFLASQLPSTILTDSHASRKLLFSNDSSFLIENLWAPLETIGGKNFLVIPSSHLTSFEELDPKQLYQFLETISYALNNLTDQPTSMAFFNIGAPAGSSISHLHAQVVSSPQPPTPILSAISDPDEVYQDYLRAFQLDLLINKTSLKPLTKNELKFTPQVYIPENMSRGFELRFIGGSELDRALLIQKFIDLLSIPTNFNYNLIWILSSSFAQLLPTFDQGMIYPHYFNLIIQLTDSKILAEKLKHDYNLSRLDPHLP